MQSQSITMQPEVAHINQQIDQLLNGLGQEGLLDDQFAQLMQLQVCEMLPPLESPSLCMRKASKSSGSGQLHCGRTDGKTSCRMRAIQILWLRWSSCTSRTLPASLISWRGSWPLPRQTLMTSTSWCTNSRAARPVLERRSSLHSVFR